MGVITTKKSLVQLERLSTASFCRRRLSVVMVRLKMSETLREAVTFIEQGHVRVGPDTGARGRRCSGDLWGCRCCRDCGSPSARVGWRVLGTRCQPASSPRPALAPSCPRPLFDLMSSFPFPFLPPSTPLPLCCAVTDPAFLVTRSAEDWVTWVDTSKIKRKVLRYNDKLDDFDIMTG
jgi:hypothetical protein